MITVRQDNILVSYTYPVFNKQGLAMYRLNVSDIDTGQPLQGDGDLWTNSEAIKGYCLKMKYTKVYTHSIQGI